MPSDDQGMPSSTPYLASVKLKLTKSKCNTFI